MMAEITVEWALLAFALCVAVNVLVMIMGRVGGRTLRRRTRINLRRTAADKPKRRRNRRR